MIKCIAIFSLTHMIYSLTFNLELCSLPTNFRDNTGRKDRKKEGQKNTNDNVQYFASLFLSDQRSECNRTSRYLWIPRHLMAKSLSEKTSIFKIYFFQYSYICVKCKKKKWRKSPQWLESCSSILTFVVA